MFTWGGSGCGTLQVSEQVLITPIKNMYIFFLSQNIIPPLTFLSPISGGGGTRILDVKASPLSPLPPDETLSVVIYRILGSSKLDVISVECCEDL